MGRHRGERNYRWLLQTRTPSPRSTPSQLLSFYRSYLDFRFLRRYIFFDADEKVISRLVTFQRSIEHTRLNSSSEERIVLRRLTRFVWRREGKKEGERRTFKFQFDVTGKGRRAMSRRRKLAQVQIGGLVPWVPHRLLIRYSNQNTWREYSLLADSRRTYATPRTSFPLIGIRHCNYAGFAKIDFHTVSPLPRAKRASPMPSYTRSRVIRVD